MHLAGVWLSAKKEELMNIHLYDENYRRIFFSFMIGLSS